MKLTVTLFFSFLSLLCFGQKVRYLNANYIQVNFKDKATFYTETFEDGPQAGTVKTYTLDGTLVSEEAYSNLKRQVRHGITRTYYPDGKLKMEATFKDGVFDGPFRTFYPTQRIRRAELYDKGTAVQGRCFSKAGYDTTYYAYQTAPQFKGGELALDKHLMNASRYPMVPVTNELMRRGFVQYVIVKFAISGTGEIKDAMVYRSLNSYYDREALRLVNSMPAWEPGKQDGENVTSEHSLILGFR